jgi:hypothetical protein
VSDRSALPLQLQVLDVKDQTINVTVNPDPARQPNQFVQSFIMGLVVTRLAFRVISMIHPNPGQWIPSIRHVLRPMRPPHIAPYDDPFSKPFSVVLLLYCRRSIFIDFRKISSITYICEKYDKPF